MMKQVRKHGFTLVETVTVLAIIGVFIGFFYTLFFLNWQACEQFLARADFGQDMDQAMDQIVNDGRYSKEIHVSSDSKEAAFYDNNEVLISNYIMSDNGEMSITRGQNPTEIISEKLDYANSNFGKDGEAMVVNMAMADNILGQTITLNSATEVYPRNTQ